MDERGGCEVPSFLLDMKKIISYIIGLIIVAALGFVAGWNFKKPVQIEKVTVHTVYKTIEKKEPKELSVKKFDTKFFVLPVEVHDSTIIWKTDSILVRVPIEQKEYGDEDYHAWVSGYRPQLDSIKIFQPTKYITKTVTAPQPKLVFGLQSGYGVTVNNGHFSPAPYIGVGVTLRFNSLLDLVKIDHKGKED